MTNIEHVFIDTSIFVKENFLEGKRIRELFSLAEKGSIKIVLPLITINEVKSRYKHYCQAGMPEFNQMIKKLEIRVFRNHPEIRPGIRRLPKIEDLVNSFDKIFEETLSLANVVRIGYQIVDTSVVFEKYFKGESPFSENGNKKHEFPDAFALASLDEWARASQIKCTILSADKDLSELNHSYLIEVSDYEKYISKLISTFETERLKVLGKLYEKKKASLIEEITDWLKEELTDVTLYYNVSHQLDVHDAEVNGVVVSISGYNVVSSNEETIEVELSVKALIDVDIIIDDENTLYKDYDDKSWNYYDTTTLQVKREFEIPVSVAFQIISEDDYSEDVDVLEYNEGNNLTIESENDY